MAPRTDKPGFSFPGVVPKEALNFLMNKELKVGFSHLDVFREEHAYHFTVAKAMQLDVLQTIHDELVKVQKEGRTFAQFKKDLTPALQKRGWWGIQEVDDPLTDKKQLAQLGSPHRLKTIFETNMRTARAAGQWERIERTKASLPYLLYLLGPSKEHRPEHAQWHGTLLPVDDPWWNTHNPINDYGCKCHVRQVTEYEAGKLKERGVLAPDRKQIVDQGTGLPTGHVEKRYTPVQTTAPKIRTREWVNKRTGEVLEVPVGIGPGFDTNPGKNRQSNMADFLASKLNGADEALARVAIRDVVSGPAFKQWIESPEGNYPVGVIFDQTAKRIGAKARTVLLSPETAAKQRREHPELAPDEYVMVQETIDSGHEIQDADVSLIYLLEQEGYVSVIKATRTGKTVFLQSFRRLSADAAKQDREIERLMKKGERFKLRDE